MINLNVKSHTSFARNREAKPVSRMWVASAIIAVATSAWGCAGEIFPATNNRVLEIPPMLDRDNTAAAILIPGDGD